MAHARSLAFLSLVALLAAPLAGQEKELSTFKRIQLTDVYYSEGAGVGDINGDGKPDIVYGPHWYEGPAFEKRHEIYEAKPQNVRGYANHFFAWVYDFNKDGSGDILVVGFPGTPCFVYENPGKDKWNKHWKKHEVLNSVANESPQFVNMVGDERPELVCTNAGHFGYATIDWDKPFEKWTFNRISGKIAAMQFGHGLGIGDVNGDGRMDIIHAGGWFEQPQDLKASEDGKWKLHPVRFSTAYGGAEMYAYDVNGDGLNDIITSVAAHEFGLSWYEQIKDGDKITFKEHVIMGSKPWHNKYGVLFSEPHSVNLADIDGDGLLDIVTGKTYWSHHDRSPMWDAGAVTYWFKLVRTKDGVDWLPMKADGEAGIGRQLRVADLNGDGLPDMAMGGMKGAHVLIQERKKVTQAQWLAAQPKVYDGPREDPAPPSVSGAQEGEALKVLKTTGGKTASQNMAGFAKGKWSGASQLFWTGVKVGDKLDL